MRAVNFRTSDIITLGTLPDAAYFEALDGGLDPELLQAVTPWDPVLDLYDAARAILSKYNFYYYHIEIRPGYYEGFSIDIENNYSYCYSNYNDKKEAQKELTQIKKFLLELSAAGLVSYKPGAGYAGPDQTKKEIIEAIKSEREYIKTIPTWYLIRVAGEL